jgi:ArsR family transcriptional regulator, arsenate/arsenite/antimonite-responsive transcriptional repressor
MAVDAGVAAAPTQLLKALADPNRWRIVELLASEELCVCHLAEALDVPQPLVSHHLKVLRDVGLVESERYRYWTYYRLRTGALEQLGDQLASIATCSPTPGERRRPCE